MRARTPDQEVKAPCPRRWTHVVIDLVGAGREGSVPTEVDPTGLVEEVVDGGRLRAHGGRPIMSSRATFFASGVLRLQKPFGKHDPTPTCPT